MKEDWSNVTNEMLAQLFPIILEPHNPSWGTYYLKEKEFLQSIFGSHIIRISHIGSTSVMALLAKPTIDILLEISEDTDIESITKQLTEKGYNVNYAKKDIITFIKGYTPRGVEGQTYHIHVRHSGDWGELYFRDYLILHTDIARKYETLKKDLREKFLHDREGYTEAKGQFINECTNRARIEFPNRYTPAV